MRHAMERTKSKAANVGQTMPKKIDAAALHAGTRWAFAACRKAQGRIPKPNLHLD
jgi:hypothetical protein